MAELCIAVGTAVVGKCTEILVDPFLKLIWNRIRRVFKSESNVKNLKEKAEKLVAERERVLQFTEAADLRGEEAALNFRNWLTSAEKYIGEMEKLGVDEDKAKKKCFAGLCPNPRARYQISKKVDEYLEAVAPLLEEAAGFKFPVSYRPAPPKEIIAAAAEGFEQFDSRMPTLNRVMEALRSASVDKIGICGLPGVGKTTLAKEVARQAENERLFDVIVMASVKKNPDLKKIQGEIADKLGLQLHGETEFGRAYQLKAYLKKKKKILVILDDIWARLDLDQLGIPYEDKKNEASSIGEEKMQYKILHTSRDHPDGMGTHENIQVGTRLVLDQHRIPFEDKKNEASSAREEKMQCKILLTSRDLNVLSCDMGTHDNIQIGTLQDEEAWTLLKKIVGDEFENSELLPTAKEIAEECAGLPLAVEVVARALKGKGGHVWRDALVQLKRPSPDSFTGISANVYSAIELSYNHLEGKELQQTFLLCCLLGHNSSIEDLLIYGIGLDLFRNVKTTGEARDRVLTLVSNLKSSSLLLDGLTDGGFDMHDIVHDVAISIALRDHHLLSLMEDYIPKELSDREALEDFKWIRLQCANIRVLPDELECPQLTLFCLHSNNSSMKIPENLFLGTQKLRVLDFTNIHFSSLPSSIFLLKNLHTLRVNGSVLEDIAIIGKLASLEVLSLSGCDIEEVPAEIGQLTQLKLLDLSDCTNLKMIRPHVLTSLSELEELYLRNSFDQWDVGQGGNQRNASLAELKDLHNLAALDVHVCDAQQIPKDLLFNRLKRYKIFIGEVWNRWDSSFKSSKILKLELNTSNSYGHSIHMLLKKTEELHLEVLIGFKNVVNELEAAGFQELKYLHVKNAPEVQHIVNSVGCVFPLLEELFLQNLNNLVKICHGRFRGTSFSRLSIITVKSCNQLKNLFSFSVARQLHKLKEIRVMECSNMTQIVDEELQGVMEIAEASENFELVQLQSLQLQNLPKFIRLCHGNGETNGSSSNSAPLFHEKIVFPNLEELQLSCINIKSIWGSQLSIASSCIQSLTKLIVEGCDHLEHLLSSSMAKSLVQLRCLEIKKCKEIGEIIEPENAEEMEDLISFPRLEILKIEHLEKHTGFYSGNYSVEFPALKQLFLENCPNLKSFTFDHTSKDMTGGLEPLFNEKIKFSSFLHLKLSSMNMQQIFNKQLSALSSVIQSVVYLLIVGCDNLKYLFTSSMIKSLGRLKLLEICDCKMTREVIATEGLAEEMILFPNLEKLRLEGLPKLARFCHRNSTVFPTLTKLDLVKCPSLETFISSPTIGDRNHVTKSKKRENAYKSPLFDAKVAFPCLEELTIIGLENLRIIWHHQPPADSFHKLKSLVIGHCGKLLTVGSSDILGRLCKSLEVLKVIACRSVERIFDLGEVDIEKSHGAQDTLLSELNIANLSRLRHVWNKDPRDILSFQNLQSGRAVGYPNLQNMFPASVAMGFQQLEEFGLVNRGIEIERVVAFEGEEAARRFVFSCLSTLYLWDLPRLKCFYPGKHVTEWPMLKKFRGYHFEGIKEKNVESLGAFPVQLPLFTLEKVVPRLKTLSLTSDDIAMICNRQFPEDLFSNVKVLRLLCYHNESADFPFRFIERFFNLEKLFIGCSSFKELFPSVASIDCQEKDVGWQLRIRKLTLDALCNLKYIWNQGSPSDLLVENLKSLKVQRCDCLISLSESTASFRNLTTLFVTSCQILRNLFSSTTAQSLVHLQTMRIEQCKLLSEIVGDEGDGLGHVIVFSKLKVLKLKCLTRLASFCSANFTFEFPLLEEVMVVQCPNFETFCHGVVRTPSLQRIQLTEEDNMWHPEDNKWHPVVELNNTINQLYIKEMVPYAGLQDLNLSDFPQLMEIWNKNPQEILDFKQLRVLEIRNCGNLTYLLTPSMALSLVTLERLKVQNSEMMEHIITEEGTMEADEKEMIFPQLAAISLESCSNLTCFCVGNYKLVFPLLAVMQVIDCPEMVTFASTFSTVQVKEAAEGESAERIRKEDIDLTKPFFSDQVSFPGLLILVIHNLGSLNMIWDDKLDADSFTRLQVLWVTSCEKLLNIFPITMLGRLRNLDQLKIRKCVSLENILQHQGPSASESQALKSSQSTMVETAINFEFPKVRRLILAGLPNLKSFYPQMHTTEWPSLETLVVFRCNQVQILASELLSYQRTSEETQLKSQYEHPLFWINKATFPSLKELTVQRNDSMKVIWYSDDVKNGILFSKLKTLKLKALPRLESICSGSCNFQFPSLKDVIVMECPSMHTFCKGEESTPKLQKVKLTEDEDEGSWEDGIKPGIVFLKEGGVDPEEF